MNVNFPIAEKTVTIPSQSHVESQRANPTNEKIKTALANISLEESEREEEKKIANDCSKNTKGCSSSKKIAEVRRSSLEEPEAKKQKTDQEHQLEDSELLSLTHFDLEWCKLTKESMRLVAEKRNQLKSLNLSGCNGLEEDFIEIARLLPNLTALNLRAVSLSESVIVQIVRHLPNLRSLNIKQCPEVTNSVIKELVRLLPNLESLDISQCPQVTDEGIRELMACRNLRELDISWCQKLTDASVEYMIQLPRPMRIELDYATPITETAIKKMRAQGIEVRKNLY